MATRWNKKSAGAVVAQTSVPGRSNENDKSKAACDMEAASNSPGSSVGSGGIVIFPEMEVESLSPEVIALMKKMVASAEEKSTTKDAYKPGDGARKQVKQGSPIERMLEMEAAEVAAEATAAAELAAYVIAASHYLENRRRRCMRRMGASRLPMQ